MIALVLAAGLGTRFRPATLTTPKPLLPLLGRPILFRLLDHLIEEGVERFVVNAHHLAERLVEALDAGSEGEKPFQGSYRGLPVALSFEDPLLGTAGALRRARDAGLLPVEPFIVANGDVFTSLGLGRLLRARREEGVVSALAVIPNERPESETALWADGAGRLSSLGPERPDGASGPWLFTGIQAAKSALADRIPQGKSELAADVLRPSLARGERAFALVPYRVPADGLWFDLGTPERLAAAEEALEAAGLA